MATNLDAIIVKTPWARRIEEDQSPTGPLFLRLQQSLGIDLSYLVLY